MIFARRSFLRPALLVALAVPFFGASAFAQSAPSTATPPAATAHARGHHGRRGHGPGRDATPAQRVDFRLARMTERLGLDAQQQAQIRQILTESEAQHTALRDEALTVDQRHARHTQIFEASAARIRPLLRADQQRIFDSTRARMSARMAEHVRGARRDRSAPAATPPTGSGI